MTRMRNVTPIAITVALALLLFLPASSSAQPTCNDPFLVCGNLGILDLGNTTPTDTSDLSDPKKVDSKFADRLKATIRRNACEDLLDNGEIRLTALQARFEYPSVFSKLGPDGRPLPGQSCDVLPNGVNPRREAIDALMRTSQDPNWHLGTTFKLVGDVEPFATLVDLVSDFQRRGEYDVFQNGVITILYKYGKRYQRATGIQVLTDQEYAHILGLVNLDDPADPRILEFGLEPIPVCAKVCLATGVLSLPCLGCAVAVLTQTLEVPETENHLNLIYVSRYLANQLWLEETQDPKYDNGANGLRDLLLDRLAAFIRNDFIEYNSHNYQDYTMHALLNLYSYADDPKVKVAAQMVLEYISAKVAVSSNDGRRSTPFRRKNNTTEHPFHFCDELIQQECADPQTGFFGMLAGVTDMLGASPPAVYAERFHWAGISGYRLPKLLHDLFVNRVHRDGLYQFLHYCNTGCNDELYFNSPSYTIAAGGHGTQYAYTMGYPLLLDLLPLPDGQSDDLGVAVATTLMPTRDKHTRAQMLRFHGPGNNLCVAPHFACGLNPDGLNDANYPPGPGDERNSPGWSFINKGGAPGAFGYYVAFYRQEDFGFLEVYDTFKPNAISFADFKAQVHANNDQRVFVRDGVNTYKTIDGTVIEFRVVEAAEIVTLNGAPPYDKTRTNGSVINADGQGLVTIKNPALGLQLTLDARDPRNPVRTPSCTYVVGGGGTHTSIQAAVNALLDPGPCEILVKDGTYNESVKISGKNAAATAASQGVVIRAEHPQLAIVTPAGLPGAAVRHAFTVEKSKFVTIQGFKVTGATYEGIYIQGGASSTNQDIVIKENEITRNGTSSSNGGLFIGRENPNTVIEGNRIHHNTRNGLAIEADVDGNTTNSPKLILNNEICKNGWSGVSAGPTAKDVITLQDNEIHCNGTAAGTTGGRFGLFRQTTAATKGSGFRQNIVLDGNQLCSNRGGDIAFASQTLGPPGNDVDNVTTLGNEDEACLLPGCAGAITGSCAVTDCNVLCPE